MPRRKRRISARALLELSNPNAATFELTDAQLAEVELAMQEVREGKIATDEEMEDVWRLFKGQRGRSR